MSLLEYALQWTFFKIQCQKYTASLYLLKGYLHVCSFLQSVLPLQIRLDDAATKLHSVEQHGPCVGLQGRQRWFVNIERKTSSFSWCCRYFRTFCYWVSHSKYTDKISHFLWYKNAHVLFNIKLMIIIQNSCFTNTFIDIY